MKRSLITRMQLFFPNNIVVASPGYNVQKLFQVRSIYHWQMLPGWVHVIPLPGISPFLKNLNICRLKLYLCIPTEQSGFF
jgi:hypothetical protein